MLIILCIVIIWCTASICNKIEKSYNEIADSILSELNYKASDTTLQSIKYQLEDTNTHLKNIYLQLDGSLDDIIYYMPKNR